MSGKCLVLGSAENLFADIYTLNVNLGFNPDAVIAAKQAGVVWRGDLLAWCTLHTEKFEEAIAARRAARLPMPQHYVSHAAHSTVNLVLSDWAGSSGLFAVRTAIHFGFDQIVIAGMPMDMRPHIDRDRPWDSASMYHKGWRNHIGVLSKHVRSMSGWTRNLLGEPTHRWLYGPR